MGSQNKDLLDCFCGGKAKIEYRNGFQSLAYIGCVDCEIEVNGDNEQSFETWNQLQTLARPNNNTGNLNKILDDIRKEYEKEIAALKRDIFDYQSCLNMRIAENDNPTIIESLLELTTRQSKELSELKHLVTLLNNVADSAALTVIDLRRNTSDAYTEFMDGTLPQSAYFYVLSRYADLNVDLNSAGYTEQHKQFNYPVKPEAQEIVNQWSE